LRSAHFRNRKSKYLKYKINELVTDKNKNNRDLYREINEFKMDYQPRTNLVKDENGDLHANSHNILKRWKNYSPKLLNVQSINDFRPIEIHTAESLVPGLALLWWKFYYKLIQAGGEQLFSEFHKLINSIWSTEELPRQWEKSITVSIYRKGDEADSSNYRGISPLSTLHRIVSNILL
jgi:hypothetical protein